MPTKRTSALWALLGLILAGLVTVQFFVAPASEPLIDTLFFADTWRALRFIGYFILMFLASAVVTGLIPWVYFSLKWLVRRYGRRRQM